MQKRSGTVGGTLAAGVLMLCALVPAPAPAATHQVGAYNFSFVPYLREANPGDTVEFFVVEGPHRVRAWRGGQFDSGELPTNATFSVPFGGGTVRYMCAIHGYVDGAGQCKGMCGIISNDPDLDITPPSARILRPTRNQVVVPVPSVEGSAIRNRVEIAGDASDDRGVEVVGLRLYDTSGRAQTLVPDCGACGGAASVRWSAAPHLLPGTYVVEAVAVDAAGNAAVTPRTSFVVA